MSSSSIHVCPVERAGILESRIRKFLQNPHKILAPYVKEGMTVLDIGCGPGFFSIEIADLVGESGMVISADLQQGMLDKLEKKIKGTLLEKIIRLHKCGETSIGVTEKIDFALAFYMVHEVPDKKAFFGEIFSILNDGGQFLVVEPAFHVSKNDFEKMLDIAMGKGFEVTGTPKMFLNRMVLLKKI